MENSKKMAVFTIVCCHGNSLQYTHMNEKQIPGVWLIFTVNARVETNSSFLVLHPPLGVDIVNTVGSHLNFELESKNFRKFKTLLSESFGWNCARATRLTAVWTRHHSRPQRPRSFWSAPRIATSGLVQRHSVFEWLSKHSSIQAFADFTALRSLRIP